MYTATIRPFTKDEEKKKPKVKYDDPMDDLRNWIKAGLKMYRYLLEYAEALEQCTDCMLSCEQYLEKTLRANKLRHLKSIFGQALDDLPYKMLDTLDMRYVDGCSTKEMMEYLGVKKTAIFQRIDVGFSKMEKWFCARGMHAEWFKNHFGGETLFRRVFKK